MRPSTKAWLGIGAGVAIYDSLCPPGETLSERVDEWLEDPKLRYAAIGGVALLAGHLLNILPEPVDPIHNLLRWKDGTNSLDRR